MRIKYAMKSAPQSEAEMLAIYKGTHKQLREAPKPVPAKPAMMRDYVGTPSGYVRTINRVAPVAVAEPIVVTKAEKPYPKWSFVVDQGKGERSETPVPSIQYIKNVVAEKYHVGVLDIESARRSLHICHARHVAAHLCATMTRRSLPAIGLAFNRDHTTILHSRDKIAGMMVADEDFEKEMHDLKQVILDTYREVAP